MDLSRVPQKLKVVHIASGDRWAGAEVQLYTLLTQLNKNDDIEPSAILLNDGELAQRLRAQHIHVDVIDESQLSSPHIFRKLIRLLRQHRPDIIHTHRSKENILGAFANLLSVRAPSIRTVHGAAENQPQTYQQKITDFLDRWTGRYLQRHIIAVSGDLAAKLNSRFDPRQIVVIKNGVDIEGVRAAVSPVDFREEYPEATHIGIVGRLDPVKRFDIFLSMAHELLAGQPDRAWHFHIFGDGAQRTTLEDQARALMISEKVTFHGHRADIASCIAGLDTLVMCSDHEGLPMTALEAAALQIPIVAHSTGGLKELLAGDRTSFLVTNHATAGYVEGVINVLNRSAAPTENQSYRRSFSAIENAVSVIALYNSTKKTAIDT